MRSLIITFALCVIIFGMIEANAEMFILEATSEHDRNDYLYIEFFLDGNEILTKNAFLKHDNYLVIFDGTPAKFYPSHGFSMKARDVGIAIYGHPVSTLQNLEYDLTVLIQGSDGKEKLKFHSHGIPQETSKPIIDEPIKDPLAEFLESLTLIGPALVSEMERLEKLAEEQRKIEELENIVEIPRSEYQLSDKEIAVITQAEFRVPWKTNFDFDIRVVDPAINDLRDYYNTNGVIDDVEITGTIKDSLGNVLKSFSGDTTNGGHYSNFVYIPENINTSGAFSFELTATKYFDEDTSFATFQVLEEFFVFVPSDSSNSQPQPSCDKDEEIASDGTCIPKCAENEIFENGVCIDPENPSISVN